MGGGDIPNPGEAEAGSEALAGLGPWKPWTRAHLGAGATGDTIMNIIRLSYGGTP